MGYTRKESENGVFSGKSMRLYRVLTITCKRKRAIPVSLGKEDSELYIETI